jgi:CBS domain containing-hemolysin-like protein
MDSYLIALHVAVLLLLFAGSAFFSGSETALFSLTFPTLHTWESQGTHAQRLAAGLMVDHHRTLIAILLGNNFVNILAAVLFNRLMRLWLHGLGHGAPVIAGFAVTAFLLVFGEVTPKTIAYARAVPLAPRAAPVIRLCARLFAPLIVLLDRLSGLVLRVLGGGRALASNAISPEEFQTFVDIGNSVGAFSGDDAQLLDRIFRLRTTPAAAVMRPRVDVGCVDVSWDVERLMAAIRQACHRRLPAVDGSLDRLLGVLEVKQFLRATPEDRERWAETCLRPAVFVPENATLNQVLHTLREQRRGMCFVVDEYGGASGLITMEDITERLVGDVADEFDRPAWEVTELGVGHWRLSGLVPLDQLAESLPFELPETSADTLGGMLTEQLGHLPRTGQTVEFAALRCVVRRVDRRRVLEADVYRVEGAV